MIVNLDTFTDQDFVQSFVYQNLLGAPIDLTGMTMRMQVRVNASDPTVYFEASTQNGQIVITNAPLGAFTLTIPLATLVNIPPGTYVHSLIAVAPTTLIRSDVWRGTITHAAGPTRWTLGQP